jgi:hypothetical protein
LEERLPGIDEFGRHDRQVGFAVAQDLVGVFDLRAQFKADERHHRLQAVH